MRLGAYTTVQNTLTQEAASVLKHSLNLARRRGHAQVTPLHVAATLLSLRASLLKRACLKSNQQQQQPQPLSYPLRCRALELCFNVALNRLPTAPSHGQPSLSNALVAALKRAQAHQRKGCIEHPQQQPPLLAIKVELDQLVISILDDPSVSRVMREAGFSSTNVKNNIEEEFSFSASSSSSSSHVFNLSADLGSSYQTHMRFQMRQLPLEVQWGLQAVSVPSAGLGLSLQSSSIQEPRVSISEDPAQLLEPKPVIPSFTFEGPDKLFTCCPDCNSNYENEAQLFIFAQKKVHLPPWLHPRCTNTNQKDELAELKRKWNNLCLSQNHQARYRRSLGQEHQLSALYNNNNQSLTGKSFSQASSYQWWPTQTSIVPAPSSISITEPAARSCVPKFRRQSSCTIDFSFRNGSQKHQAEEEPTRLDSLRKCAEGGKEENISLSLGSSFVSGSGKSEKGMSGGFCRLLRENVPWQSPAVVSSIAEALNTEPKSATSETWLLIDGNDTIGKRRLALAIAEAVSGCSDSLLRLNMSQKDPDCTERLAKALRSKDGVVVLVEEVGLADINFLKFLADRFEEGKFRETGTKRENHQKPVGQAIFILTGGDHSMIYQDGVIRMMLKLAPAIGHKRRADTEMPSSKIIKSPRIDENTSPKRDLSRQSSINTLDLNTMADDIEEAPGKFSPNSSDLTRETCSDPLPAPHSFLDAIHNRYVFNKKEGQDREVAESLWSKFKRVFEEVLRDQNIAGYSFSIEERVIEEILDVGIGSFLNSKFDEWLKEVFQTSLREIGHRGEGSGGGIEVKLCFGGKSDRILEDGFLGTFLPNKIKVSFID